MRCCRFILRWAARSAERDWHKWGRCRYTVQKVQPCWRQSSFGVGGQVAPSVSRAAWRTGRIVSSSKSRRVNLRGRGLLADPPDPGFFTGVDGRLPPRNFVIPRPKWVAKRRSGPSSGACLARSHHRAVALWTEAAEARSSAVRMREAPIRLGAAPVLDGDGRSPDATAAEVARFPAVAPLAFNGLLARAGRVQGRSTLRPRRSTTPRPTCAWGPMARCLPPRPLPCQWLVPGAAGDGSLDGVCWDRTLWGRPQERVTKQNQSKGNGAWLTDIGYQPVARILPA